MTDEEIEAGAAAFCRTLRVAGGRTSYDYAVRAHLPWFGALLARGLGWAGIIRILSAAGVHRDGGLPLSRGHLSSVYWRQVHASRAASSADPFVPKTPHPRANEPHRHPDPIPSTAPADVSLPVPVPPPVTGEDLVTEERRDLRAFMRRAAALRRPDSD